MNPVLTLLSFYFIGTGSVEFFLPKAAQKFYEKCLNAVNFRPFSIWAFGVAAVAYLGSPAAHYGWFIVVMIWVYGFLGLWILIDPASFQKIYRKTYFDSPIEMRYKLIFFDGLIRIGTAFFILLAARK
jgi:hypothetical protein